VKWLFVERLVNKGLALVVLILFVRRLGPSESAPLLAATTIVALAQTVLDTPVITYLLRESASDQNRVDAAMRYLWKSALSLVALSITAGVALQIFFKMPHLAIYTAVNSLILLAFSLQVSPRVALQRSLRLEVIGKARLVAAFVGLAACLLLWVALQNAFAVLAFYLVTEITVSLILWPYRLNWNRGTDVLGLTKEVSNFASLLGRVNGLMWLTSQGSALASAYFLDAAQYAQFALGMNAIRTGIDVLTTPAMQATLPTLKRLIAEKVDPTPEFRKSVSQVVALSVLCTGGVLTFGQLAVQLALGKKWGTDFPLAVSLLFVAFPLLVHACLDRTWLVLLRLERLDSKIKNLVALSDICEAILFASLGLIWCAIGLGFRSLSGLCFRRGFSRRAVPSLRDESLLYAIMPIALVPTLLLFPDWIHQLCGILLMAAAIWVFIRSKNPGRFGNDSSWENFLALNPQLGTNFSQATT
jgi:O-antigen/teichoic acid export membrane protein